MDLFNKKKVAKLEDRIVKLFEDNYQLMVNLENRDKDIEKMKDNLAMMDDELRTVALARYANRYVRINTLSGVLYGKVCDAESHEGQVTLYAKEVLEVEGNEMFVHYNENGMEIHTTTLSHFHTITTVIKAKEYYDIHSKYSNS